MLILGHGSITAQSVHVAAAAFCFMQTFGNKAFWELHTSEECSGTNHCKDTGRDCGNPLANKTASKCTGVEGRNDDPSFRYF